jgi:hypothetical protein
VPLIVTLKYSIWVRDSKLLQASHYLWVQGRFLPHGTAVVPALDGIDKSGPVPWVLISVQQIEYCVGVEVHSVIEIGSLSSNLSYREQDRTLAVRADLCHGTKTDVRTLRKRKENARGRSKAKQIITLTTKEHEVRN